MSTGKKSFLYLLFIGYFIISCSNMYFYCNSNDIELNYNYYFCLGNYTNGIAPQYKKNYDNYQKHIFGFTFSFCFNIFLMCSVAPIAGFILWSQGSIVGLIIGGGLYRCLIFCSYLWRNLYIHPLFFPFIFALVSFISSILDVIFLYKSKIIEDENVELKTIFNEMVDNYYKAETKIIISFCPIIILTILYFILNKYSFAKDDPEEIKTLKIGIVFKENITIETNNNIVYSERNTVRRTVLVA